MAESSTNEISVNQPSSVTQSSSQLSTILDSISGQLNSERPVEAEPDIESGAVPPGNDQRSEQRHSDLHALSNLYLLPYLYRYGAFVLILLLKVLYTHRYGLLIILAAVFTWIYANSTLVAQVTLRNHTRHRQYVSKLAWVILVSAATLCNIYYWFDDKQILSARLWFYPYGITDNGDLDLWGFFWILILNDYAVKFATITAKAAIALLPKAVITHQKKSSLFSFLERATIFYRSLLPIIPWYYFLLWNMDGLWFSVILFVLYVIAKQYGIRPNAAELSLVDDMCPICHDEYRDPLLLNCQHIFCEECVLVWFDREKSCPLCRAVIVTEDATYRDGSSNAMIQFY